MKLRAKESEKNGLRSDFQDEEIPANREAAFSQLLLQQGIFPVECGILECKNTVQLTSKHQHCFLTIQTLVPLFCPEETAHTSIFG